MPPAYPLARDLSGRVIDARTGDPIADATVIISEAAAPAFKSSSTGTFSTGPLRRFGSSARRGFLTVRASADGYRSAEQRIPVTNDHHENAERTHWNIVLRLEPK